MFWVICGVVVIILLLLLALGVEIGIFISEERRESGNSPYFMDPLGQIVDKAQPITDAEPANINYDASYWYRYIPHYLDLSQLCEEIREELTQKLKLRFTMITGIYHFQAKHTQPTVPLAFKGPPSKHLLCIIPLSEASNSIFYANKEYIFKQRLCVVPTTTDSTCYITSKKFILVVVQPFFAWDII